MKTVLPKKHGKTKFVAMDLHNLYDINKLEQLKQVEDLYEIIVSSDSDTMLEIAEDVYKRQEFWLSRLSFPDIKRGVQAE